MIQDCVNCTPLPNETYPRPCLNPDNEYAQECAINHRYAINLLERYAVYQNPIDRANISTKESEEFRLVDIILLQNKTKQETEQTKEVKELKDELERRSK